MNTPPNNVPRDFRFWLWVTHLKSAIFGQIRYEHVTFTNARHLEFCVYGTGIGLDKTYTRLCSIGLLFGLKLVANNPHFLYLIYADFSG
jgi:hypothetical protein